LSAVEKDEDVRVVNLHKIQKWNALVWFS